MRGFIVSIFVISLAYNAYSLPDGYKASTSNLIKVKERSKSKDILILEKTIINGGLGSSSGITGVGPLPGNNTCVKPHPQPTTDHTKFLINLLEHRTYVTLSSQTSLDGLSKAIYGKPWDIANAHIACIRFLWKQDDKRLFGYDTLKQPICPEGNILDSNCICKMDLQQKKKHRFTTVWTDGKHHALVVGCSAFGHGSWKVLSNKRSISAEEKADVLKVLIPLGFNTSEAIEVPYETCPKYVKEAAFEGPCDPDFVGLGNDQRDVILNILKGGVYAPMSNLLNIYGQSRFLRGISLTKDEELNHVCRKDEWNGNTVTIHGFDNHTGVLNCDTTNIGNVNCIPDDSKSTNKRIFIYNTKFSVVWTDSKKYVLAVNCLSNDLRTWVLYSTTKSVEEQTQAFVSAKVADYGFDINKVYKVPYEECKFV